MNQQSSTLPRYRCNHRPCSRFNFDRRCPALYFYPTEEKESEPTQNTLPNNQILKFTHPQANKANSLPVFIIPSTDSQLGKYGDFPTKGILLPPSPHFAPSKEGSIRFKGPSRVPSFRRSTLESIPEEEFPLPVPSNAVLRGNGIEYQAKKQPELTQPACSEAPPKLSIQTPQHLSAIVKLPSQTSQASSTNSRKRRLSRLQSLLEVPYSSKVAKMGVSTSMPSILSLPSWLAERALPSQEITKSLMTKRETVVIGPSHLRFVFLFRFFLTLIMIGIELAVQSARWWRIATPSCRYVAPVCLTAFDSFVVLKPVSFATHQ